MDILSNAFRNPEALLRLVGGGLSLVTLLVGLVISIEDAIGNITSPTLFFHYVSEALIIMAVSVALSLAEIQPHPVIQEYFPGLSKLLGRAAVYLLLAGYFMGRNRDASASATCVKQPDGNYLPQNQDHVFQNYILGPMLAIVGGASLFVGIQYHRRSVGNTSLSQPMNDMYPSATDDTHADVGAYTYTSLSHSPSQQD